MTTESESGDTATPGFFSRVGSSIKSGLLNKHAGSSMPKLMMIPLVCFFLFSFIWVVVWMIQIGEGEVKGSATSSKEDHGHCAERCALPFKQVLVKVFVPPLVCAVVALIPVLYGYYMWEDKGQELFHANQAASTSRKKSFIIGIFVAFILWIVVSIAWYLLMSLGNVKAFKQKEYSNLTTKTACTGAKKAWCTNVGPNTFWFFLFSLVVFFVVLVVFVIKFFFPKSIADELCDQVKWAAMKHADAMEEDVNANPPPNVATLISGPSVKGESAADAETRMALGKEFVEAREKDSTRCAKVYEELRRRINAWHVRRQFNQWVMRTGGTVGLIDPVHHGDYSDKVAPGGGKVFQPDRIENVQGRAASVTPAPRIAGSPSSNWNLHSGSSGEATSGDDHAPGGSSPEEGGGATSVATDASAPDPATVKGDLSATAEAALRGLAGNR